MATSADPDKNSSDDDQQLACHLTNPSYNRIAEATSTPIWIHEEK